MSWSLALKDNKLIDLCQRVFVSVANTSEPSATLAFLFVFLYSNSCIMYAARDLLSYSASISYFEHSEPVFFQRTWKLLLSSSEAEPDLCLLLLIFTLIHWAYSSIWQYSLWRVFVTIRFYCNVSFLWMDKSFFLTGWSMAMLPSTQIMTVWDVWYFAMVKSVL